MAMRQRNSLGDLGRRRSYNRVQQSEEPAKGSSENKAGAQFYTGPSVTHHPALYRSVPDSSLICSRFTIRGLDYK